MRIPFAQMTSQERSRPLSVQRLLNLFPHQAPPNEKTPIALYGTPGLTPLGNAFVDSPVRGVHVMAGVLFVVAQQTLYRVDSGANALPLGTIPGDGPVYMENNGTQIFIANANNQGFIGTITSAAQINDPDFPGSASVAFIDGYFVFNPPGSQKFYITAINDGSDIDALDFASAEANPDLIVRVFVDHRELWLFGESTIEIWYNSGASPFPFERVSGAIIARGCMAPLSVASMDNSIFWLADDGIVYRANGYTPVRVSTHTIERRIAEISNPVRPTARAYSYTQEGHAFYVLTFPNEATIVYDAATGLWHERQTTGRQDWATIGYARVYDRHITGSFTTGKLHAIDLDAKTEDGTIIRRQAVTPSIWAETGRFTTSQFQVDFDVGHGAVRTFTDNLLRHSEAIGTSPWVLVGATVSADVVVGGEVTDKLVENAALSTHNTQQTINKAALAITYTATVDAVAGERTSAAMTVGFNGTNRVRCIYDLIAGTAAAPTEVGTFSGAVASVEDRGGGVYRLRLSGLSGTELTVMGSLFLVDGGGNTTYTGDGSSGAYFSKVQLESKASPSEYRPTGAVAETTIGIDPQAMLDWSDDGGHTWSNEHWVSLGLIGKYRARALWRRLGQSRQRNYRVTVSDPVFVAIAGAYAEMDGGKI